jgi:hypothetical protein
MPEIFGKDEREDAKENPENPLRPRAQCRNAFSVNRTQDVADGPVGRSLSFSARDFVRGSEVDACRMRTSTTSSAMSENRSQVLETPAGVLKTLDSVLSPKRCSRGVTRYGVHVGSRRPFVDCHRCHRFESPCSQSVVKLSV